MVSLACSPALNDTDSSSRSSKVCRRLAPIFSTDSFTCHAISAMRVMALGSNSRATFSVLSNRLYCSVKLTSGSVNIRAKSSALSGVSSTRMGNRPCISGIRSEGRDKWNAPDAMNRMWSVLIIPYLVDTWLPSINGRRSRCTPSRETSAPPRSADFAILSNSSMKTMPVCSTAATVWVRISSSLTNLLASSCSKSLSASLILRLRRLL